MRIRLTSKSQNLCAEVRASKTSPACFRPKAISPARARSLNGRWPSVETLGPEHPDTAASLNILARLLWDEDNFAGARPLLERALAIREKVLGPEHPDTAISLNDLASLLQAQGDLAGARRPRLERALAIREKALGPERPDTAKSLNILARLLQAQGDLASARRSSSGRWRSARRRPAPSIPALR